MSLFNMLREKIEGATPPEMHPVTVRFQEETLSKADEIAEEFGVTRSEVLRFAVDQGVKEMFADMRQAFEDGAKTAAKGKK